MIIVVIDVIIIFKDSSSSAVVKDSRYKSSLTDYRLWNELVNIDDIELLGFFLHTCWFDFF